MSEKKVHLLLDGVGGGLTADEAETLANENLARQAKMAAQEALAKGEKSVQLVEAILDKHKELFREYRRTIPGSDEDKSRGDIIVTPVRAKRNLYFPNFSIEVKSSPRGVRDYQYDPEVGTIIKVRQEAIEEFGKDGAIDRYLMDMKIILLDASSRTLEKDLLDAEEALWKYWQEKGKAIRKKGERFRREHRDWVLK